MTIDKLIAEMDQALQFPGVSNAWTMPIKARIDMLSTGIRTPVGVKVFGTDLDEMERLARRDRGRARATCRARPAPTPSASSAATTSTSSPTATQLARYGLMVGDVQDVIAMALGAETVTTTVEGRERYAVSLRYPRDSAAIRRRSPREVLVPLPDGGTVPLGEVAKVSLTQGPLEHPHRERPARALHLSSTCATAISAAMSPMRSRRCASEVNFPPGYYVTWSGQFEYLERAEARLQDRRAGRRC